MRIFSSSPLKYVKKPEEGWKPSLWASKIPFKKIDNFVEVFRAIWENRTKLGYTWRILNEGVCDGCALGTSGMNDWTIDGVHLCNVRLRLLKLNTMGPLDINLLADVAPLKEMRSRDLRNLGRLPYPMIRRYGDTGFTRISWDEALDLIAERIKATDPDRTYTYLTSRGIPNETYYAAQKAVRAWGTNNIDNAARICHSPSTFGLKAALGVAATTCSYSDFIGTDLVTFFGSNVANNQPVVMKYLYHAKKAGTKVVTVNPYREPGMEKYYIPSDIESAVFGTKITDRFFQIRAGGDIAFLHGTVKAVIANNWYDESFISQHTAGFETLRAYVESLTWEEIERACGLSQAEIKAYAEIIRDAERAVFVWGMGITQHTCGEDNVAAIINLALMKGFVGRPGCGLMPIRGHSGVQGGAEMGAYANVFPGGKAVNAENAASLSTYYGFEVPHSGAYTTPQMLDAAAEGNIDVLFAVGGNFREVMPGPFTVDDAIEKIPLRVHMDIFATSQMLYDTSDTVILLPAVTRYEIPGGVTETSTERRVIFSPEIEGPRIGEARSEWDVLGDVAARVNPTLADKVHFKTTTAIRDEIAEVVGFYDGIQNFQQLGDQFQYGGDMLCKDWEFPTPDGKAHFSAMPVQQVALGEFEFAIVSRRGKQFNSMVHEEKDTLNRLQRNAILISAEDARRLGVSEGDDVTLSNEFGRYQGAIAIADIANQTVQVYWPEGNVLFNPEKRSSLANIPAYKEVMATIKLTETATPPAVRV